MVCTDLGKFLKQSRVIARETSKFGQTPDGAFMIISLDQVAGCFGEDEHADNEDDGPCELDCDRDTVGSGIVTGMGGVVHDSG
jgi:hypothetical protein